MQLEFPTLVLLNQRHGIAQYRHHSQTQQIDLDDLHVGTVLSHCTMTRPGILAFSSGATESSWPAQITIPPLCCPKWRGRSCKPLTNSKNLRTRGCCKSMPAS